MGSDTSDGIQWDQSELRFDKYNRLALIESYLKKLEADHPDRISLIKIGESHEKRPLTVVKVSWERENCTRGEGVNLIYSFDRFSSGRSHIHTSLI